MTPAGDNRRFCARCSKHVHFLSAMSEAEAELLLADRRAAGERICVRYQSLDDEILFQAPLTPAPFRAFAMLAGLAAMMLTGCGGPESSLQVEDSAEATRLWVELEPKPIIPDLEQPTQPELTPCDPPKPANAAKKTRRDRPRKTMGIPLEVQGDPLGP